MKKNLEDIKNLKGFDLEKFNIVLDIIKSCNEEYEEDILTDCICSDVVYDYINIEDINTMAEKCKEDNDEYFESFDKIATYVIRSYSIFEYYNCNDEDDEIF